MTDQPSRTESLLAALVLNSMRDLTNTQKIMTLTAAGLSSSDIAKLLGTTTHSVSQAIYEGRKGRPKAKPSSAWRKK